MNQGSEIGGIWSIVLIGGEGEGLKPLFKGDRVVTSQNNSARLSEPDRCFGLRRTGPMGLLSQNTK